MDPTFVYNKYVTGKNNFGRRNEQTLLSNLLSQGENVVIYEPPKTGKTSLIQQTFFNMRISGKQFSSSELSLLNIRSTTDFILELGSAIIRSEATTPEEFTQIAGVFLQDTHFVFDPAEYSASDSILSLTWDLDENDIRAILALPYRIAESKDKNLIVILNEFQNIMLMDNGERLLKIFEKVVQEAPKNKCSYLFVGSRVNAMKEIFENKVFFHRLVTRVKLNDIEAREITDRIVRGFLTSGKVIDRDIMMSICKRFRCNIWYINHFSSICDYLTKGYITEATLLDALSMLIAVHEPRFLDMMADLTGFQISLLKATLAGCKRFSSAEVIEKYHLNSSANVRRLKDALCKKEILTFDEDDNPVVLDPLFEYWARTYFFGFEE